MNRHRNFEKIELETWLLTSARQFVSTLSTPKKWFLFQYDKTFTAERPKKKSALEISAREQS